MNEGQNTYEYVFQELRAFSSQAVPVASLDMDEQTYNRLKSIIAQDQQGVGLRVRLEDLMKPDFNKNVAKALKTLEVGDNETDLLIDLEAPSYKSSGDFVAAIVSILNTIANLDSYRNVVIIGTSFPESLANLPKGESTLPRSDWQFYKFLIDKLPAAVRRPNYGDYTIIHPSFVAKDMRLIKPACKVIYATSDEWYVQKGGSFRDKSEQMHSLCEAIEKSSYFRGANYSFGDEYIQLCASKNAGPSNLGQWKKVGINHHIMVVLDDLSKQASAA